MAAMKFITDAKKLSDAIASIARRGKKLDADIHRAACSTLLHMRDHGDTTMAAKLIAAMPRSSRRKALIVWFEAHAPMAVTDNKSETTIGLAKGRTDDDFKIDEAVETPFWDFTVEKNPAPATLDAIIAMFAKRVAKVEGVEDSDVENMVAAIRTAAPDLDAANDEGAAANAA